MKTKLDLFFENTDVPALERANNWSIKRDGDLVFFELPAKDFDVYRLRIECDEYDEKAPSVVFVDAEGSRLNPRAWPKGGQALLEIVKPPPNCFLCTELTREGLQHHTNWKALESAWCTRKHSLLDIFNLLHRLLRSAAYEGRGG